MPGYRAHLTAAGVAAVGVIAATHWSSPPAELFTAINTWYVGASLLGGLFPDVDIKSNGQKVFYYLLIPLFLIGLWQHNIVMLAANGILAIIPPLLPHRGPTHHPLFLLCIPLIIPALIAHYAPLHTIFALRLTLFFMLGALTHIILDFDLK